mmetsp:Transcript_73777/g.220144  ORF Transcript_73777/g.220144 Transcript_73777/m.220144 type:complete len:285 (-) Transcript_73777:56-910(-)
MRSVARGPGGRAAARRPGGTGQRLGQPGPLHDAAAAFALAPPAPCPARIFAMARRPGSTGRCLGQPAPLRGAAAVFALILPAPWPARLPAVARRRGGEGPPHVPPEPREGAVPVLALAPPAPRTARPLQGLAAVPCRAGRSSTRRSRVLTLLLASPAAACRALRRPGLHDAQGRGRRLLVLSTECGVEDVHGDGLAVDVGELDLLVLHLAGLPRRSPREASEFLRLAPVAEAGEKAALQVAAHRAEQRRQLRRGLDDVPIGRQRGRGVAEPPEDLLRRRLRNLL